MGFIGSAVANGVDGWAAPFVTKAVVPAARRVRRLVSAYPRRAALLLAVITAVGGSVVAVHDPAAGAVGRYALPFAPEQPFMRRSPDPPPKQVPAILAPGRLPFGSVDAARARTVGPFDYPERRLSAVLLTDSDITAVAAVKRIEQERDRAYVLPIDNESGPCGETTFHPHQISDHPYLVWRMTGSTAGSVTHFASSATELVSPTEANDVVHDVAEAASGCRYTRRAGTIEDQPFVQLSWKDADGPYRDLVVVRDENMILQVATSQDIADHARYAELLARRLVAKWTAVTPTPSASPPPPRQVTPTRAPDGPQPSEPQPTGTPPNPPGCLPPVCRPRSVA